MYRLDVLFVNSYTYNGTVGFRQDVVGWNEHVDIGLKICVLFEDDCCTIQVYELVFSIQKCKKITIIFCKLPITL